MVEQGSHAWPLLPGGELLSPKRQEDHQHPPAAGRRAPPGGGPERTAAQDEYPTVSIMIRVIEFKGMVWNFRLCFEFTSGLDMSVLENFLRLLMLG